MMQDLTGIIAILCTIALPIGLGMYMGIRGMRQKHAENMELIKQGIVPNRVEKKDPNGIRSLRNGMLCVGIALGLLTSYLITGSMNFMSNMLVSGGCVLFFLGLAYVAFYFVSKDKINKEIDEE